MTSQLSVPLTSHDLGENDGKAESIKKRNPFIRTSRSISFLVRFIQGHGLIRRFAYPDHPSSPLASQSSNTSLHFLRIKIALDNFSQVINININQHFGLFEDNIKETFHQKIVP